MPKDNSCAENTIEKAFQVVLSRNILFNYDLVTNDDQIDIGPVFLAYEGETAIWTSGNEESRFQDDFLGLNPNNAYFMRTGTASGAGHYQLVYFDRDANGWRGYSSETNQALYTKDGKLTSDAIDRLMTHSSTATWGLSQGNYAIHLYEATPERIIAAANFVHDYRTQSTGSREDAAIAALFENISTPPELNTADGFIVDNTPSSLDASASAGASVVSTYKTQLAMNKNTPRRLEEFTQQFIEDIQHKVDRITESRTNLLEEINQLNPDEQINEIVKLIDNLNQLNELAPVMGLGETVVNRINEQITEIQATLDDRLDHQQAPGHK